MIYLAAGVSFLFIIASLYLILLILFEDKECSNCEYYHLSPTDYGVCAYPSPYTGTKYTPVKEDKCCLNHKKRRK